MAGGTRRYLLERVDEAAVVQVYADGFTSLSLRDKVLAWHLYLAALAGRDIYYDQRYAHGLEMRQVLEALIEHPQRVDAEVLAEIRRYTKLFWINSGPFNNLTARKFVLRLTRGQLAAAMVAAAACGACLPLAGGEDVAQLADRMAPMFLDPQHDPIVTSKFPAPGRDILEASANNLYVGVSMADLDGLDERHGLNALQVKHDVRDVE
jgi:dipeptidyl-peptidase-3